MLQCVDLTALCKPNYSRLLIEKSLQVQRTDFKPASGCCVLAKLYDDEFSFLPSLLLDVPTSSKNFRFPYV